MSKLIIAINLQKWHILYILHLVTSRCGSGTFKLSRFLKGSNHLKPMNVSDHVLGKPRPWKTISSCWEMLGMEERGTLTGFLCFASHVSTSKHKHGIRDEVKGKCHISRGFISSNCDARRHLETLYALLQFARMEISKDSPRVLLLLWRKLSTRGCAHTVKMTMC